MNQVFTLMALAGLLLAGYGLMRTPAEFKGNPEALVVGGQASSSLATEVQKIFR